MAMEVTMPKFGLTMHEGTLQRLFKAAGESVTAGEPLYEVETEKVLYVVESPATGTVAVWIHEEGATIECGGLVAVIAEAGEDSAAIASRHAGNSSTKGNATNSQSGAATGASATPARAESGDNNSISTEGRRAVSPVARKLAAELKVDLSRVNGTGPGGRVTREDVERAAKQGGTEQARAGSGTGAAAISAASPDAGKAELRSIPLRGIRRAIATRMHQSLRDTAQLTITSEIDITAATELRARLTREFDFTYTDMLIQAAARALVRHPRMNSRIEGDAIVTPSEVNIGMAVALDEGLIVPVIHDADRKSLRDIAAATRDLAERARSGKLRIEDVSGGTFTVTNLGTWGVDAFTPILNLGETGILGVGRIVEKPAIYRGEIAKRSMVTLSLSFDHRVIDGAPSAAFLQTVGDFLNFGDR
jgi:pyruvate dehydrogenase E2 component (dihydrolipoamide acetyltransferase)